MGRDVEFRSLLELLEHAAGGHGETLLLGGDAGVGKTRLCRELKRECQSRGVRVIEGRCSLAESSVPYGPFLDALRFRLQRGEGETVARFMGPLMERLAPLLPEAPRAGEAAGPLVTPDRPFEAVYDVLRRLTDLGPVALVLEDIHWADPTSCDLLQFLAGRVGAHPVLLVATYRTDELYWGHPARRLTATLERQRLAREMVLAPFTTADVSDMVAAILGTPPDSAFVEAVWRRTEGNPLFVEEFLRSLLDAGVIGPAGPTADDLLRTGLPATISETILGRVEALGPKAMEALAAASVTGRRMSFDLLREVTGWTEEDLLPEVERLVAHQLLVEAGGPGNELYSFRHSVTQEALYHGVIARRRRFWHRRVATALEARPAEERPRHFDALAYHFRLGGEPERARTYELLAAEQAARLCAWADAEAHYERALEGLEERGADRVLEAQVLEKLAEVTWRQSRAEDSMNYTEEALALLRAMGDRDQAAALLRRAGGLYGYQRRDWDRALECYREAISLLEGGEESVESARTLNDLGRMCLTRGRLAEAADRLEDALRLAGRLGSADERAVALASLGELAVRRGEIGFAVALLEEAGALVETAQAGLERAAEVYRSGARALETSREHRRALAWIERALAHAERHGVVAEAAIYRAYRAAVSRRLGRWERALEDARAAADELRAARRAELGEALRILGDLRRVAGDLDAARQSYEEALRLGELDAEVGLALIEMAEGRPDAAAFELRRILGARDPAERLFNLRVLPFLVEALARSGDESGATAALEELELTAGGSEYRAARAALAHAAGLARHRAQDLETAAGEWRAIEQPFEEGQALADLANELLELDGATRAVEAARAALDIFERLGSRLEAERARGLLRRAGVRPGRTPAAQRAVAQDHGLTPREMEVLSQLVKGQTNREIARVLGIAEKTVGIHMSHILAKLGCTTRTQAVRQAITKRLMPTG